MKGDTRSSDDGSYMRVPKTEHMSIQLMQEMFRNP